MTTKSNGQFIPLEKETQRGCFRYAECTISTLLQSCWVLHISADNFNRYKKKDTQSQISACLEKGFQTVLTGCLDRCDTLAKMSHSGVSEIWQRVQTRPPHTQSMKQEREWGGKIVKRQQLRLRVYVCMCEKEGEKKEHEGWRESIGYNNESANPSPIPSSATVVYSPDNGSPSTQTHSLSQQIV